MDSDAQNIPHPLGGEGHSQHDDIGLGRIIAALLLRPVDEMSTHDALNTIEPPVLDLMIITNGLGADECTSQVDVP
jgi:hypothetical protein